MTISMLDEDTYVSLASRELANLVTSIDILKDESFEAELENDILTLEFPDDASYVINSHRAARQIWMAAERTAWHFDWVPDEKAWKAQKTGDELWSAIERSLSAKLGRQIRLPRPAGG